MSGSVGETTHKGRQIYQMRIRIQLKAKLLEEMYNPRFLLPIHPITLSGMRIAAIT